jgi:olefin beta-lactone synthetase
MPEIINIATTLRDAARRWPDQRAIVVPMSRQSTSEMTFRELDRESDRLAYGLQTLGYYPGDLPVNAARGKRIVLMVRPGLEFIALTFALFKVGAIVVLIDPGMGPRKVFRCLDQVEPDGFVAIPFVHLLRLLNFWRFPQARLNVVVNRSGGWWPAPSYSELCLRGSLGSPPPVGQTTRPQSAATVVWQPFPIVETQATDPAAIIFTSGSTGPAKGVVYEHGMFAAQVEWLRDFYTIEPGGADLPGFPLFGLFNVAMGMTTVIPDMDPARPAQVDPAKIVAGIEKHGVTQGFGSPAIWKRVGEYCEAHDIRLPTVQRIFSAGAPVSPGILGRMKRALTGSGAEMYTPYGATESLPVCSISATEVLHETAQKTREGAGTCVGKPLPKITLKVIEITDGPIKSFGSARELPVGRIGEIVVRGDVVTREYFRQPEATANAKIPDGDSFWHRMGDVGYLDDQGRLWFCGRKGHLVETSFGRLFTDQVEPIFNTHPRVYRTALVGVGAKPKQKPVVVVETESFYQPTPEEFAQVVVPELRAIGRTFEPTRRIEHFLLFPGSLPVDVRHNIKINREQLAVWAARRRE